MKALDFREQQPEAASRLGECVAAHEIAQNLVFTGRQSFRFAPD